MRNNNILTLEEFKEKNYGKRGTERRNELEAGYKTFKTQILIHEKQFTKKDILSENIKNDISTKLE